MRIYLPFYIHNLRAQASKHKRKENSFSGLAFTNVLSQWAKQHKQVNNKRKSSQAEYCVETL